MSTKRAALIRDGWIDILIVPVSDEFEQLPEQEQDEEHDAISKAALAANLQLPTVLIWKGKRGQTLHRGPARWRAFMESVTVASVERRLTHTISW